MRRIAFALALMIVSGWAAPAQAQWWGGGWGRPCFGGCRPWRDGGWAGPRRFIVLGDAPGSVWDGPAAFAPPRFRAGGWGRAMWRREMRWRRAEAWRRWADAGRNAATPPEAERLAVQRPTRWRSPPPSDAVAAPPRRTTAGTADAMRDERRAPARAESAVAMFPTGAMRFARSRVHAAMPSHVLAAAAMLRRTPVPAPRPAPVVAAVVRPAEPPARPAPAALRRVAEPSSPSAGVRPVVLRNQPAAGPAPTPHPRAVPVPAAPEPAVPEAVQSAPADVPVAPLD